MKKLIAILITLTAAQSFAGDFEERLFGSEKMQNALLTIMRASEVKVDASHDQLCEGGTCGITVTEVVCEEYPLQARNHCQFTVAETDENGEMQERRISTQRLTYGPIMSIRLANEVMEVLKNNDVPSIPVGAFGAGNLYQLETLYCDFNTEKRSNGRTYPVNVYCNIH